MTQNIYDGIDQHEMIEDIPIKQTLYDGASPTHVL